MLGQPSLLTLTDYFMFFLWKVKGFYVFYCIIDTFILFEAVNLNTFENVTLNLEHLRHFLCTIRSFFPIARF